MKRKLLYITLLSACLSACNNDFLERLPEDSLVTENYFKSPSDLELFVNKLYLSLTPQYWDIGTDNVVASEKNETLDLIHGNITPATVGGWYWGQIRELNWFLDNAKNVQGDQELINHWIGIVRMLRAEEFYKLVKRYNDVPWYDHALSDTDTEELYKPQDNRTFVVDKIMEDLEYATQNVLPQIGNRTAFNQWYAYGLLARIALHEGTFRKYHDELGLGNSANEFLEKAVKACEKIMANTTDFEISTNGGVDKAYANLFISNDLSNCKEMILFKDYDHDMMVKHFAAYHVFAYTTNLSRSLMESYLVKQGDKAVPFSTLKDYQKKSFVETFTNRDPRFAQTFMYPGYIRPGDALPFVPNMNLGGYPQIKFVPNDPTQVVPGNSSNDLPLMRLGEVLLTYAEAKAELGTLTQGDLDKSINLLRDRVGMPHMNLSELTVDPMLEQQYPNVVGAMKNAILEIRRERRVELACEGFRTDDLYRWKTGKLLEKVEGVYIKELNKFFDVTGDGIADVGVFLNKQSVKPGNEDKICYYLEDDKGEKTSISLSEGDHGYIVLTNDVTNPKKFVDPQYYYYPIPQKERVINPNLKETIFWE